MKTNQKETTRKFKLSTRALKAIAYTALVTVSLTVGMHLAQASSLQSNKVYGFQQSQAQNDYDQLDAALAPIALYPDSLLTHILIASTYPLEVIEAARFIQQHPKFDGDDYKEKGLSKNAIEAIQEDALEYGWDASVVALTAFPDILNNMSDDLGWLSDLGDAFENDQELVLSRVQKLRELAYDQGNLQDDDQVEIVVEREKNTRIIVIQPRRHEVVYVPYYDSAYVYGPSWHVVSSYRWSRPYYARHHRHSYVYFSPGAYIGTRLLFGGIHWTNHHISVNRDWSYRNAHNYSFRNTQYKRVNHQEYQRWDRVKRQTRHTERQRYAGKSNSHNANQGSKWVTNKHSEFAKVRSSERKLTRSEDGQSRALSRPVNRDTQKQKLHRKTDKSVSREDKPAQRTEVKRSAVKKTDIQRNDKVNDQSNPYTSSQKRVKKSEGVREKTTHPQREVLKQARHEAKPERQVLKQERRESQPAPQMSKPERQVAKSQRQVSRSQPRSSNKPQRQTVRKTKSIERSKH